MPCPAASRSSSDLGAQPLAPSHGPGQGKDHNRDVRERQTASSTDRLASVLGGNYFQRLKTLINLVI